jgi:hypothetical protein
VQFALLEAIALAAQVKSAALKSLLIPRSRHREPLTYLVLTLSTASDRWARDLCDRYPRRPVVRLDGAKKRTEVVPRSENASAALIWVNEFNFDLL